MAENSSCAVKAIARITLLLIPLLATPLLCSGVLPMRDQWRAAAHALATGNPQLALARFREFDQWYGNESAVRDPGFRKSQLRLWGLAALQAGEVAEGIPLLVEWLGTSGPEAPYRAFIRFQVALAFRQQGDNAAAVSHWRIFLEEHPSLPETALVRWMWAEQLMGEGRLEEARIQLEQVLEEDRLPRSGRALALAAMALVNLGMGDGQAAVSRLDGLDKHGPAPPPLRLWRALLAPSMVEDLLEEEAVEARRVATWFESPDNLVAQLRQMLEAEQHARGGVRHAVWNSHWQDQGRRLETAIEQLEDSGTGMDTLFRLRLRTLIKTGQTGEALCLAEFLLQSPSEYARNIRSDSHAAAIEACLKENLWEKADAFAASFCRDHPDDPDLPDILFLMARIAAERKDFAGAVQQVDALLETIPAHRSAMAWRMTAAGWLLDGGKAATALSRFDALLPAVPKQWTPLLAFQRARCLQKLGKADEAVALLRTVTTSEMAANYLKEQAFTTWLGICMRQMNPEAFHAVLSSYRQSFPDGINRLAVENLAGSFAIVAGDNAAARQIFTAVSGHSHPDARYAHEQLSSLFRQAKDYPALRRHALAWMIQAQKEGHSIPVNAMEDCILYQEAMEQTVFEESLLASLMELFHDGNPALPGIPFLELMESGWPEYSAMMGINEIPFAAWRESEQTVFHRTGSWLPYSHCLLFTARQLDEIGRHDSADTRRMEVLRSVDPSILDPAGLYSVAATADNYDFPEGASLLEAFIQRFPEDGKRPEALFRLAQRLRRSGGSLRGEALLAEILTHWPDAPIHSQACLMQARWSLEDGDPSHAAGILQALLERTGLPPVLTAQALLLRARADFHLDNPERGRLACQRILALYPAFEDITAAASALLQDAEKEPAIGDA